MAFQAKSASGRIANGQINVNGDWVELEEFARRLGFTSWDEFTTMNEVTHGRVRLEDVIDAQRERAAIEAINERAQEIQQGITEDLTQSGGENQQGPVTIVPPSIDLFDGALIRQRLVSEATRNTLVGQQLTDIYKTYLPETQNG
jgi:hypothetical protein